MRAVNLLPSGSESRKSFRKEDPAVVVGSVLGLVVLFALVAGFLNVHSKVNGEQKKLTAARSELAKLSLLKTPIVPLKPVVQKPIIPTPAVTSEQQPLLDRAHDRHVDAHRLGPDPARVLARASERRDGSRGSRSRLRRLPSRRWRARPMLAASEGLSITGTAFSHDGVARLLSRLMLIPDLSNVTLGSATAGTTPGSAVQFSITASIKGAPALPPLPAPVVPTDTTTDGASS